MYLSSIFDNLAKLFFMLPFLSLKFLSMTWQCVAHGRASSVRMVFYLELMSAATATGFIIHLRWHGSGMIDRIDEEEEDVDGQLFLFSAPSVEDATEGQRCLAMAGFQIRRWSWLPEMA
jgi:hypothetical protein